MEKYYRMQEKLDIYRNRKEFKIDFERFLSQERPYELDTEPTTVYQSTTNSAAVLNPLRQSFKPQKHY